MDAAVPYSTIELLHALFQELTAAKSPAESQNDAMLPQLGFELGTHA
jgi:hypothetical protein